MRTLKYLTLLAVLSACGKTPEPTATVNPFDNSAMVAGTKVTCQHLQSFNGYPYRFTMTTVKNLAGDVFMTCEVALYSNGYSSFSVTPQADAVNATCKVSYTMQSSGPYNTSVFSTWTFRNSTGAVAYEQSNYPAYDGTTFTYSNGECL